MFIYVDTYVARWTITVFAAKEYYHYKPRRQTTCHEFETEVQESSGLVNGTNCSLFLQLATIIQTTSLVR